MKKNIIINIAFLLLLAGCATDKFTPVHYAAAESNEATVDQGVRYLFGRGVPSNQTKAFYYFKKAADNGDKYARNEVAYLYAAGKGTAQNYEKALFYYQLAAYQNVASAQFNLGLMYAKGLGTRPNQIDAIKWIEKSAMQGFWPAKQYLRQHKLVQGPHAYTS